jgi:glutamate-5-semialdehyde dehydrogenase
VTDSNVAVQTPSQADSHTRDRAADAPDCTVLVAEMGQAARRAARQLAALPTARKAEALNKAADAILADSDAILAANATDMERGAASGLAPSMLDRLKLDAERIAGIVSAVRQVAALPDPVGQIISSDERPNGLQLSRQRVPIGVIGIIYESRPNVTVDAAALCVMSGNAAILRGGSEAKASNRALHAAFARGLAEAGLPSDAIQLMPTQDRAAVGAMLTAAGVIDMIIPRGGKSLVARVQADARVPVLAHLDGICHTYVHASADIDMARQIVVNAKMRRTGICGAMECLLIDQDFPAPAALVGDLLDAGCEVRADDSLLELDARCVEAEDSDWGQEFLAPIVAARLVSGLEDALDHIDRYGSGHTDAIVATAPDAIEGFLNGVDSAIAMVNASSQFADGGEFGLGAEIGISTGRLHARGPVALEGLTTYRWVARGSGQTRP